MSLVRHVAILAVTFQDRITRGKVLRHNGPVTLGAGIPATLTRPSDYISRRKNFKERSRTRFGGPARKSLKSTSVRPKGGAMINRPDSLGSVESKVAKLGAGR